MGKRTDVVAKPVVGAGVEGTAGETAAESKDPAIVDINAEEPEGEGTLPLGSDTDNDGSGGTEGGDLDAGFPPAEGEFPAVGAPYLPTEEELKEAFERTPGLAELVVKVLAGIRAEETKDMAQDDNLPSDEQWADAPLEAQIDRKFRFTAFSRRSGTTYTECDGVVFLARDPAFLYALDGYLTGCIALGADVYQIEAVKALRERVSAYQDTHATKLPDVEPGEERDRLMARF